jgi:hypothetical protein
VRPAAVTALLLLVTTPARGQDAERAPPDAGTPANPPRAKSPDEDADFQAEVRPRSIALGPNPRGDVTLSLDLGWLESGLRADLGMGAWIDLVLAADTMLLYQGFGGQSGIQGGVRFTPVSQGAVHAGVELTVGQLFSPDATASSNLTTVRGELAAGVMLDWATLYGRFALRGISGSSARDTAGWTRDEEFGFGVERVITKRFIVGAEGYLWARPGLSTLGEWRIRLGYAR